MNFTSAYNAFHEHLCFQMMFRVLCHCSTWTF